jgi:hypothetical protein
VTGVSIVDLREDAMRTVAAIGMMLVFAAPSFADSGDDTLRSYLKKSALVVLGEITSEPIGMSTEAGVLNYICDFRIAEVLDGERPADDTIRVAIIRFENSDADRIPELKQGSRWILFLKSAPRGATPVWETADVWFGVQRPSPWMARSLKRLSGKSESEAGRDIRDEPSVQSSDDSLRQLLKKTDCVVAGEITSEPNGPKTDGEDAANYSCDFRISDVLAGETPAEKTIRVSLTRIEQEGEERLPELKKGAKLILFLARLRSYQDWYWKNADFWFGIQPDSPSMARTVKRLSGKSESAAAQPARERSPARQEEPVKR